MEPLSYISLLLCVILLRVLFFLIQFTTLTLYLVSFWFIVWNVVGSLSFSFVVSFQHMVYEFWLDGGVLLDDLKTIDCDNDHDYSNTMMMWWW